MKLPSTCRGRNKQHTSLAFAPFLEGLLNEPGFIDSIVGRIDEIYVAPLALQPVKLSVQWTRVKVKMKFIIKTLIQTTGRLPMIAILGTITTKHDASNYSASRSRAAAGKLAVSARAVD